MLDKFIFENHLGQRFEGLPNGVYLNHSDLRNYSWSFDTINNRISRFYRGITNRKIPLVVYCKTDDEAVSVMNRLHELAEADIVEKIPGKIFVGDYYTSGYITASSKSDYLIRRKYCKIELTLTSDDPAWYREQTHPFHISDGNDHDPITPKYAEGTNITINDSSDGALAGLTLYGNTTQNDNDLVSSGGSGSLVVSVTGKNLFGGEALADKLVEVASATKDDAAGTVEFRSNLVSSKVIFTDFKPNTQYTIMLYGRNTNADYDVTNLRVYYTDGTYTHTVNFATTANDSYCVFITALGKTVDRIQGNWNAANTILHYDKCGIFEGVLTEADFEPYVGNAITVSTPDGLHSIGEVKDEIDFARGVYVKRIVRIDSYSGEVIPGAYMSTTGELSEGATVLYVLSESIETPLSADELSAFAALRTNKPNTSVFNDGDAYMVVGYYPAVEIVTDFGGGADYPYDYPHDYSLSLNGRKIVCNSVGSSAFMLLIYGEATNPAVIINGHTYTVNGTIGKGEILLIDSKNKTITLTTAAGKKINWFDKRGRDQYIFEPIPAGQSTVTWAGAFGFDLTVVEKRSEPKWT